MMKKCFVTVCLGFAVVSAATDPAQPVPASSDTCLSNSLFAAEGQVQLATEGWQCSPEAPTAGELNDTTTATSTSASPQSDQEQDPSSGGWTGPHACAGTYCVYSHPTFAMGRGIVLIAEGEAANAIANLPTIVQLASSPSAEIFFRSENVNAQTDGVETKEIPGKGRGFVATRVLPRGEQIIAYTPAVIMQRGFFDVDSHERKEQLRVLRDAVSRLPQKTRVAFWKQLGPTHTEGDGDILDVIMNNSFNLPLTGGGPFVGNFPEVSMFNHDCRPSVAFHLDGGVIHRTQVVAGKVMHGEELSISYVDSFRARHVRRERTRRNWGFDCGCAQCALSEALANASDHRLWRIYEVENALTLLDEEKQKAGGMRDVADRVELLLSLYAQERLLESHGSSAYKTAALNYSGLQRRELAIKYALLALEAYVLEEGARSAGVVEMVALLEAPEEHWSWGRRTLV